MLRTTTIVSLLALTASPAAAQIAPEIGYIYPPGGKAGTTVEVMLGGSEWTPDMQFFVHDQRVKLEVLGPPGELLIPPPPYWFGAKGRLSSLPLLRERPAKFVLPAELPPGPIRWQAANANGATAVGVFIVGTGNEVLEDQKRLGAQVLPALPVTVSGRLWKNEEVDRYRFTSPKAGPLTLELTARRLGSNFNGVLELFDATGKLVAEAVDTEGNDPALTFNAVAGAEYTVAVRDIDHAGDRSFTYRLSITPAARVLATLPAVGKRGETREVEFRGAGFAPIKKSVAFPAGQAASFTYQLETPTGTVPVTLPLSDLTEGVVSPSAQPIPLTIPGTMTGVLDKPNAEARFALTGKKGDRWLIAAEARKFGSPLDMMLRLLAADGKEVARNDDLPGTTDAGLDFTLPADGTFTLIVSDTAGTAGSPIAIYRVSVRVPENGFTLTVPAQKQNIQLGGKPTLSVKATRTNFKGPIAIAIAGLPPGVSVPPNLVIPEDKNELAVSFEIAPDAAVTASLVTITGSSVDVGGKPLIRQATAPILPTVGNLAPRAPEETPTLLFAMTMKPRVKAAPVDKDTGRKVPRGSTHPADITLERLEGFSGEIVLRQAARQSYQVQGITGRDVIVPPGATTAQFPCFMPEWLETSRTSRMGIMAEVKVPDPKGNVRHLIAPIDGFVTMTMEGALLKLSHVEGEFTAKPGESFTVRVKLARSSQLAEPVRLELKLPEELAGTLTADAVVVPAGQVEVDFRIATTNSSSIKGEHLITIRGTAVQPGNLQTISETFVPVTFPAAGK